MKGPWGGGWTEPGGVSDSRGFQPVGNPLILGVSQAEIQKMQPQWRSLRPAPLSNGIVHFLGVSCWSCLAGEPKHKTTRPSCPVPRHNNSLLQESQSLSATPLKFQMRAAGSCPDQDLEEITAFSTQESPIYFFFELMGIQSIFASYQFSAS